jgi:hypothetical protein
MDQLEADQEKFAKHLTKNWGREETGLRQAIYCSFLKDQTFRANGRLKRRTQRKDRSDKTSNSSRIQSSIRQDIESMYSENSKQGSILTHDRTVSDNSDQNKRSYSNF